jgi:phospholipase A1
VNAYKNPNYPKLKVTTDSKFQAASISKIVTAFAALRLVARNKLNLDENINDKLRSWKIPINNFTASKKVTLRNILNMTSGLSVSGFSGYPVGAKLPSLLQILEGQQPANSEPVLVTFTPGTKYFYSAGGFLVLQQLIRDVVGTNFAMAMHHLVLNPLFMRQSFYAKSLHKHFWRKEIPGFYSTSDARKIMIPGGWHNYPELASNGLWSTPKDLARFVINIMQSYQGKPSGLLPQSVAKQMLTKQKNTLFGLGVMVQGKDKNLNFIKIGKNFGYIAVIIGFPNTGQGAVLMINDDNNFACVAKIVYAIERKYKWPIFPAKKLEQEVRVQDEETKFILSILGAVGVKKNKLDVTTKKIVKQIQQAAAKNPYSERLKHEAKVEENPFAIGLFQPNYILPFYYTGQPAYAIYGNTTPDQQKLRKEEFKAQFSFRVPIWHRILHSRANLYVAYTQLLYWQVYASSAYFRETNYQPELFLDYPLFNWNTWRVGAVHQSNGRGGNMERSWNRLYVEGIFSLKRWMLSFKPWVLIKDKSTRLYNRDITHYLGHGRLVIAYKYHQIVLSLMTRNNIESGFKRGAVEAALSFPIFKRFHGYIQYFHGYGQSLIEYNHRTNSFGIGFALNNWI